MYAHFIGNLSFTMYMYFRAHNTIKCCSLAIADIEEDQSVSSVSSLFPTPLATPTTETPDVQPEEGRGEGGRESDSQAVAIAVSTSLLTVLAVTVIVAVGVILCWRISTRNRYIHIELFPAQLFIMHALIIMQCHSYCRNKSACINFVWPANPIIVILCI